jgi:hypothetical protein
MKVTVEPISANMWSNIVHYKNCYTDISTYFLNNGSKYTGLTKEDKKRLEEELGFDLSPNSDYWKTFFIRMTDKPLILDLEDPYDELRYLFLKGHKLVQTSVGNKKATAKYVIVNEEAEAQEINKKSKIKRNAFKAFDKLSNTDIEKALRLYGYKSSGVSNEQAEAKLYDLVDADPQKFLEVWVDNKDREVQFLIEAAIAKNIIRKNKNVYMYGTETIGHSLEDTIAFLNDKKNQDLKLVIINETDIKK